MDTIAKHYTAGVWRDDGGTLQASVNPADATTISRYVPRNAALIHEAADAARTAFVEGKLKRVGLELGGKAPSVLFEDAELDLAVAQLTHGSLETFADELEAVAKANANATVCELAVSVFTRDHARAMRVSRAIRAGTRWINAYLRLFAEAETGGYGQSGLGRLHGPEGLQDFLETKHIFMEQGRI